MGTDCVIIFQDRYPDGRVEIYTSIYQHYDGYPSGMGNIIVDFLKKVDFILTVPLISVPGRVTAITVPLNPQPEPGRIQAEDFGDMVTRFIKRYKREVGEFVIFPSTRRLETEYKYIISNTDGTKDGIRITIEGIDEVVESDIDGISQYIFELDESY